ncbi:MAG: acetate/propionate family kinase [Aquabacterium sp.]|jgi:acetate kinase|uniref:acetate/propionate family kinase n=1 Tax=Aquabacterium sp. TaxID=1872578 RepID=UPI001B61C5AB|nr:acetate/propionate family kinase [Aquabacterium sp.]MBP7131543.1 acetate/propionate family kinase [Aquabacterium sp.]MBP9062233.1 acetate/propionate family kinase [Aquabacterium sp.]MDQ5925861.1 acetate kinase [Pseudomonadota bacterium]
MKTDAIAVLNAGSSSLKFSVFTARILRPLLHGQIEGIGNTPRLKVENARGEVLLDQTWSDQVGLDHEAALAHLLALMPQFLHRIEVVAVGHRIVHGGMIFQTPVVLTQAVVAQLAELVPLAPLHQPHNLAPVRALMKLAPHLPQVGCFDTAFHTGAPEVSQRFALPREFHHAGVQRYGFHGLSYEYIAARLPEVDRHAAKGRTVVMHLGNGASMCALQQGRSVASTMGFTALDGLPMGTRCGNIDPGVLLWLMDERGLDARQIETLLYKQSGLLGVSGLSSDMRTLLASEAPAAREAIDLYVYRIQRELGSLAAALGGLDSLVFTAGIGEHAAAIRARICQDAAWLGVTLDPVANTAGSAGPGQPQRISQAGSAVSVWVIPTNEEWMIARHTRRHVPDFRQSGSERLMRVAEATSG